MKKILLTLSMATIVVFANAQKVTQKTVSEICGCVKKIDAKLSEDEQTKAAITCMAGSVEKNMDALKKEYNIKTNDIQQAAQEVGGKLGVELITGCPEILPHLMNYAKQQQEEVAAEVRPDINIDTLKLDSKVCAQFKAGKYKAEKSYMNKKDFPNPDPSAYTEVKDGFVYDYSQDKKYTSKWSIRWISACEWEQTLVESSEPNLKTVMKKGDKLVMKAIGSTSSGSLWVSTQFMGIELVMLLTKTK